MPVIQVGLMEEPQDPYEWERVAKGASRLPVIQVGLDRRSHRVRRRGRARLPVIWVGLMEEPQGPQERERGRERLRGKCDQKNGQREAALLGQEGETGHKPRKAGGLPDLKKLQNWVLP